MAKMFIASDERENLHANQDTNSRRNVIRSFASCRFVVDVFALCGVSFCLFVCLFVFVFCVCFLFLCFFFGLIM